MVGSGQGKSLEVLPLAIPDVKVVVPRRFADSRGFFAEIFSRRALSAAGIDFAAVQDNQSFSRDKGTVRGLHFQLRPFAQAKLFRVARGSILDVAVDIRRGSPNYGRHVSTVLQADRPEQIYVPIGFAHGFCTLEPNTEVFYKVDVYHSVEHERGIRWNDSELGIKWPVSAAEAILSAKDEKLPFFRDMDSALALQETSNRFDDLVQPGISRRKR